MNWDYKNAVSIWQVSVAALAPVRVVNFSDADMCASGFFAPTLPFFLPYNCVQEACILTQETQFGIRPLSGKISVVTGGGRGIGQAISSRLAQLGATVVVCGRQREALEATAAQIRNAGGVSEAVTMDVSSSESVDAAQREINDRFGSCRILVNNAGIRGPEAPLHEIAPEDFDAVIAANLRGTYLCMRAFTPSMIAQGGGDIVNISSIVGRNPLPRGAVYAASKWAMNGLSYSVAEELRNFGIRVSVISPARPKAISNIRVRILTRCYIPTTSPTPSLSW